MTKLWSLSSSFSYCCFEIHLSLSIIYSTLQLAFWIYLLHLLEACGILILILTPLLWLGSDCEGDESLCLGPGAVQCILSRACPVSSPEPGQCGQCVVSPGPGDIRTWPLTASDQVKMMTVTQTSSGWSCLLSDKWGSQEAQDGRHWGDWGHPRHWRGGRGPGRDHHSSDHHPENSLGTDAPCLPAARGEITLQFSVAQIRNLDWLKNCVHWEKNLFVTRNIESIFMLNGNILIIRKMSNFNPFTDFI